MTPDDFINKVKQTVTAHGMMTDGDRVLAAVSGGADSVALLQVLHLLAADMNLHLAAAHLNHGLRAQADRDAGFVFRLSADMGIACHLGSSDVHALSRLEGLSLEEAGRRARYAFLEDVARQHGFTRIALGHHMDDNAELVLMVLLRGSGPLGLSGIPPVRAGRFVRPLIRVTRTEIGAFLDALGCDFVTDTTNLDGRFVRNRIRHRLLPLLKSGFNPRVVAALNRTLQILADEDDWARQRTVALFEKVVVSAGHDEVVLAVEPLRELHVAARRRVVRMALGKVRGTLRRIDFSHIRRVLELVERDVSGTRLHLPGGLTAERRPEKLVVRLCPTAGGRPREAVAGTPDFSYQLDGFGRLRIQETGAMLRFSPVAVEDVPAGYGTGQRVVFFDIDSLRFPLTIRNIRSGDRFVPLGMRGSKKVARFFGDCKIPAGRRRGIPLVISGGRIVWVAGHRIDERARLGRSSRGAVKGELVLA